ncbi:MAG: M55 family metallopeptidase [Bryobacteraceae bacterium]|nr:M55 family metallopeptidase [Bryobacteraceae bacterium]
MALRIATFLFIATQLAAQPRRILVITDGEGVAGICRQEQTDPDNSELRQALAAEANAAVDGFLAGGADEVVVWDGHDGSRTLSALTIHPKAKLLMGAVGYTGTLERGYAAIAFVGQHAMANVQKAIMGHSFSSLGIQNMKANGKPVGEIDVWAANAGHYGIPVIFLSGDQAAADELKAIVPDAELVVVKEGLARYTCLTVSAQRAQEMTREGARRAMAKLGRIKPYKVSGPVTLEIEFTTRNSLGLDAGTREGTEIVDDRTIRFRGANFLEAWKRYRAR